MPALPRRIVLSRFFNNNVRIVANMCPRCYEESVDVKIISVNLIFLTQTVDNLKDEIDFLNNAIDVEENSGECGFDKEEIDESLKCAETLNGIVSIKEGFIKRIEEQFARNILEKRESNIFLGFTVDDYLDSSKECKKIIKAWKQIRCKIYRRASLRILKNISKTHKTKMYLRKQGKSKNKIEANGFLQQDSQSKYFSVEFVNNNNAVPVKEEFPKLEEICKDMSCLNDCTKHIKIEPETVDYETEYFKTLDSKPIIYNPKNFIKINDRVLKREGFEDDEKMFIPPRSPHNLIEECLYHDPWALLVATIFLNRTSCMCARPYVFWFLNENPDPLKVLDRYPEELEKYFVNLGLQKTRAAQVWRMSHDFVYKNWNNVKELYGIGVYGENAFRMFCLGDFSVEPKDRFLKIYKAWYQKIGMKRGFE